MKHPLTLLFGSTLLLSSLGLHAAAREARLTNVSGKVYLHPKKMPSNEWVVAEKDTPLEEGDTLRTGADSSAEVTLDGDTVVLLNQKTEFQAETFQGYVTRFFLAVGSLTAKIRKLRESNEEFSIHTPVAVAAVRGTELAVITYEGEEDPDRFGVFDEGQVVVKNEKNEEVVLNPNQETDVVKGVRPTPPHPLEKLAVSRAQIVHVRERIVFLKPRWQSLPPIKREEYRAHLLEKLRVKFEQPARLAPSWHQIPKMERHPHPEKHKHPEKRAPH